MCAADWLISIFSEQLKLIESRPVTDVILRLNGLDLARLTAYRRADIVW